MLTAPCAATIPFRNESKTMFLPSDTVSQARSPPAVMSAASSGGVISIELPSGIRVSVDATVDADALSRVIGILTR